MVLEFASIYESTRCCGPNENVDPIDARERELDGDGRRGIGKGPNGLGAGGVEVIVRHSVFGTRVGDQQQINLDAWIRQFSSLPVQIPLATRD